MENICGIHKIYAKMSRKSISVTHWSRKYCIFSKIGNPGAENNL